MDEFSKSGDVLKITLPTQNWILIRLSSTAPRARIYVESCTSDSKNSLITIEKKVLASITQN